MCGEDLVIVFWVQVAFTATFCKELLKTHHDRIGETTQKHDNRYDDIHDTNLFVVYRNKPLIPQISPFFEIGDTAKHCNCTNCHKDHGDKYDWLCRDRVPTQFTKNHIHVLFPLSSVFSCSMSVSCCVFSRVVNTMIVTHIVVDNCFKQFWFN